MLFLDLLVFVSFKYSARGATQKDELVRESKIVHSGRKVKFQGLEDDTRSCTPRCTAVPKCY